MVRCVCGKFQSYKTKISQQTNKYIAMHSELEPSCFRMNFELSPIGRYRCAISKPSCFCFVYLMSSKRTVSFSSALFLFC